MNALLRLMQGDPRSTQQIRDDLREEMQCHIDLMREELKSDGIEGEEAERLITERFGDESHWRMKSESVILGERIMLQKILVVLVLALAAGLGWSVWEARTSRLVMRDEMMKLQEQIGVLVGKSTRPAPLDPGLYYMSGKVQLNGPFSMTSGLTLSRALAAARCEVGAKRASVTRKLIDRTETKYFDIATLTESNAFDPPLMADDLVVVD